MTFPKFCEQTGGIKKKRYVTGRAKKGPNAMEYLGKTGRPCKHLETCMSACQRNPS